MIRILYICTGNSGRSMMAASFTRKMAPRDLEIVCAGDSGGELHPIALRTLTEMGEKPQDFKVHELQEIQYQLFDVVVTLCNHANEICPTFPGSPARINWPLMDPAKMNASEEQMLDAFYMLRDEIRQRVESLFHHDFFRSMQQSRRTLSTLLDNLTDGVLAHDFERRIFFFNKAAEEITGFEYSEVVGRDCHEVFPARFCGENCSFCENPADPIQSKLRYPRTFITRKGERRDLEMSVVIINAPLNEKTGGALVIFRDITEIVHLRHQLENSRGFCGMVGRHASMQEVFDTIRELADINVPILIQGESGTGKEMVATALHQLSKRSDGPFVPVNCGALPEGTLESELFGHVKGAFTGAVHDRKGRFALAEGGTIFLDEIGEISPATQVKLLRVIQEKSYMPVGGEKSVRADVRVICATNKDLKQLTRQGRFRSDLYYRLAVMPIHLPALRERGSDVSLLANFFLERFSSDTGRSIREISPKAIELLNRYPWPGNVRELGNAIQYAMVKCRSGLLDTEHLPPEIRDFAAPATTTRAGRPPKLDPETVEKVLRESGRNRSEAARLLGVSRPTLYRFLEKHNLSQNTDM
jgi:PAS domain S-box-containing protein